MIIIEDEKRKARKEYKCDFCDGKIEIGEEHHYQKNKVDSDLYSWRIHLKCSATANYYKMYDDCDEGLTGDDFQEYINEKINDLTLSEKIEILYNKISEVK